MLQTVEWKRVHCSVVQCRIIHSMVENVITHMISYVAVEAGASANSPSSICRNWWSRSISPTTTTPNTIFVFGNSELCCLPIVGDGKTILYECETYSLGCPLFRHSLSLFLSISISHFPITENSSHHGDAGKSIRASVWSVLLFLAAG